MRHASSFLKSEPLSRLNTGTSGAHAPRRGRFDLEAAAVYFCALSFCAVAWLMAIEAVRGMAGWLK